MVTKIDLGLLALGALAVFLVVRGAGKFFSDIKNPFEGIEFPSIGDITFPDITTSIGDIGAGLGESVGGFFENLQKQFDEFFELNKSDIAGETVPQGEGTVTIPPDTVVDPDTGIVTSDTPPTGTQPTTETFDGETFELGTFAQERAKTFDFLVEGGFSPSQAFASLKKGSFGDFDFLKQVRLDFTEFFGKPEPAPLSESGSNETESEISNIVSQSQIGFPSLPAGFEGGGPSFLGGSIFETPVQNLSLSQIIDKFNVTASQAANIQFIAGGGDSDFDFGTNTGGGIGSVIAAFEGLGGNVSSPVFEGLTLQEIANKLTGGNISNF